MNFGRLSRKSRAFTLARLLVALQGCFGALGVLTACGAASGGDEQLGQTHQTIAGGTPDSSHENVFLLVREEQGSGSLCTATLIAPNLLLTARHCVSPGTGDEHVLCGDSVLGAPYPAQDFFCTNDAQPRESSAFFKAVDIRVPGLGHDTCGYDLALIILDQNVPEAISKPAVPRIDRSVEPGEVYTAVGYGLNERGAPTGARMERSGLMVACEPGSCGEGVESTEFRGETGICSGDSGGPAIDADGKVVGVVSRGGPDCDTPIYGTVTAWQDFIIEIATEAAQVGGYEPPFWVTTRSSDEPLPQGTGGEAAGEGGAPALLGSGEDCDNSGECEHGLVCFASAAGEHGTCTATCSSTADCDGGQECRAVGDTSVCATPTGNVDEPSGCALVRKSGASSSSTFGGILLSAALAAVLRRRRKQ